MDSVTVPFSYQYLRVPDYSYVAVQGVVRMDDDALVIEFRERLTMNLGVGEEAGPVNEEIRTLRIAWRDLQGARMRMHWLVQPRLELRTRTLSALDGFPLADGTRLLLPVAWRERGAARELAVTADALVADARLRALEAADQPPPLPPPGPRADL